MKIAIACFNLFTAGGARLVFKLAQCLEARGEEVVIYTPELDDRYYRDLTKGLDIRVPGTGNRISYFKSRKPRNFLDWVLLKIKHEREFVSASKAIAAEMEGDFDAVNVQDSSYRVGYYYKKKNPRAKVVWTVNGPPFRYLSRGKIFYDIPGYIYQFFNRLSGRKFMAAIDEATVLAETDKKNWFTGLPLKRISVVRAGLDFGKFYAPVKDFQGKARKKQITLMALGALNVFRRYDDVIRAVRRLRDWEYDVRAVIIAANIWNEDKCRDDLVSLVNSNNLQDYVELRFRGVSETELAEMYRRADMFVQAVYVPPPGHHGWGLVIFEAMAAGLPVVICRAATATEVLKDGVNAFFVDPLSPEQIAEKVKLCIDSPEIYRKVAKAGQEVARGMTWGKYADGVFAAFSHKKA